MLMICCWPFMFISLGKLFIVFAILLQQLVSELSVGVRWTLVRGVRMGVGRTLAMLRWSWVNLHVWSLEFALQFCNSHFNSLAERARRGLLLCSFAHGGLGTKTVYGYQNSALLPALSHFFFWNLWVCIQRTVCQRVKYVKVVSFTFVGSEFRLFV